MPACPARCSGQVPAKTVAGISIFSIHSPPSLARVSPGRGRGSGSHNKQTWLRFCPRQTPQCTGVPYALHVLLVLQAQEFSHSIQMTIFNIPEHDHEHDLQCPECQPCPLLSSSPGATTNKTLLTQINVTFSYKCTSAGWLVLAGGWMGPSQTVQHTD